MFGDLFLTLSKIWEVISYSSKMSTSFVKMTKNQVCGVNGFPHVWVGEIDPTWIVPL